MIFESFLTFIAIIYSFSFAQNSIPTLLDPRIHYNMIEIVCSAGYYVQEHKLETDDGYLLTIYRIPNGKRHPKIPPRSHHYQQIHDGYHPDFGKCFNDSRQQVAQGPPVLMAHGVLASSDGWVLQGPNNDLAFMLVDRGYDVWFSNIRGNFYSRKHRTLRPSQPEFWDFSFHENGSYDIPKIIDYILDSTKYKKVTYVGHSMGTTMFFVMTTVKPEYNDKVDLFVGLAPVAQIRRQSYGPSRLVVLEAVMALLKACDKLGVVEFLPRTRLADLLFKTVCSRGSILQDFCYDFVLAIFGNPSKLLLREYLPIYFSHAVNGVSTKTFLHYDQLLDAPSFRSYNHSPETNLRKYGQVEPLQYDLTKVKVPVALFYSTDDYISEAKAGFVCSSSLFEGTNRFYLYKLQNMALSYPGISFKVKYFPPQDIEHLQTFLPNLIGGYELSKYNHVDFIWAYTAKKLIYYKVMEMMNTFSNQSGREDQMDLSTLE